MDSRWTDMGGRGSFTLLFHFVCDKRGLGWCLLWPRQSLHCHVAKDDLEFLILLPPHALLRSMGNHSQFIGSKNGTKGFVPAGCVPTS